MDNNINIADLHLSNVMEDETEFIPLLSAEDEEIINSEDVPPVLPILPLRNTVLFPGVVIPITVGRDKSIRLIKEFYKGERIIGVVSQKDGDIEDPGYDDLNKIGTVAYIIKILQLPMAIQQPLFRVKNDLNWDNFCNRNPILKLKLSVLTKMYSHQRKIKVLKR
jgi:ATP-dependent Lon protease